MFSVISHFVWILIQVFIGFNILLPALFYLIYNVHHFTKKEPLYDEELHEEKDYAVIVSVCEQSETLQTLLRSLSQLDYTNYVVYVVMNDNCVINLCPDNDKIVILPTKKLLSDTLCLHRFAVENFKRPHTHVAILDSNSLVEKDYLNNLSFYFHQGYQAVQSRQFLKETDSIYRIIQAAGTVYDNLFKRELAFELGFSSVLSDSGSAFTIRLYKQCLQRMKAGDADFVASLQKIIIKRGYRGCFCKTRYSI